MCPTQEPFSTGFRVNTLPHIDGKIIQELQEYDGDVTRVRMRWVIDSREKGVRDALVQLGWTPPNAEQGDRNVLRSETLLAACDIIRRLVKKVNMDNEYDEHNCPNSPPCRVCELVTEAKALYTARRIVRAIEEDFTDRL